MSLEYSLFTGEILVLGRVCTNGGDRRVVEPFQRGSIQVHVSKQCRVIFFRRIHHESDGCVILRGIKHLWVRGVKERDA